MREVIIFNSRDTHLLVSAEMYYDVRDVCPLIREISNMEMDMGLSDAEIKKVVIDELYWDDRVDASKIMVQVDSGKVVLTGNVPSYMARDRVEAAVLRIRGVTRIENKLTVLYTGFPADKEIRFSIQNLITANPELRKEDIRISVVGGVVTLEGSVTSYWKKTQARKVACGAEGVLDVVNRLTVVPTARCPTGQSPKMWLRQSREIPMRISNKSILKSGTG